MLYIAQITDPHIAETDEPVNGQDNRGKFRQVLKALSERRPDTLILTGDLAFPHGTPEIYQWIRQELDDSGLPYLISPGNHDDPSMMQEVFNLKDQAPRVILTGAVALKGESLMFLDSSSERLTMKHALWLKRELTTQPAETILFMHHPPCPCRVRVMDEKYPYKNPDLFQQTILESGSRMTIFCGHYHIERTVEVPGLPLTVHIAPPTLGSLDPDAEDYRILDPRPGWRDIRVERQAITETGCFYLD